MIDFAHPTGFSVDSFQEKIEDLEEVDGCQDIYTYVDDNDRIPDYDYGLWCYTQDLPLDTDYYGSGRLDLLPLGPGEDPDDIFCFYG